MKGLDHDWRVLQLRGQVHKNGASHFGRHLWVFESSRGTPATFLPLNIIPMQDLFWPSFPSIPDALLHVDRACCNQRQKYLSHHFHDDNDTSWVQVRLMPPTCSVKHLKGSFFIPTHAPSAPSLSPHIVLFIPLLLLLLVSDLQEPVRKTFCSKTERKVHIHGARCSKLSMPTLLTTLMRNLGYHSCGTLSLWQIVAVSDRCACHL